MAASPNQVVSSKPAPTPAKPGTLAYVLHDDIFVAKWDGSNPVKIADSRPRTDCDGNNEYGAEGPMWSPDGRYLAYRREECEGSADSRKNYVVISDQQGKVVTSFPAEGWGISWSPDSTRVAVWVNWERGDVGVFGLDGERQALLEVPPLWHRGETDPVWSPDGDSLQIARGEIPLDGSPPRPLPWADHGAAWWKVSPDGSRVAYTARHSFIVAEADGSNPQEVFGHWAALPLWSPAGDRLAFVPNAFRDWVPHQIRVLDVATGAVRLIAEWEGSEWLALIDFSPAGDRILFSRVGEEGAGPSSLWSINVDGSDTRRLVPGSYQGDWFSPIQT